MRSIQVLRGTAIASTLVGVGLLGLSMDVAAQDPAPATLEGQVLDSITDAPMAGVLIRLDSGAEALSDDRGRFRIEGLAAGPHMYAVMTADCRVSWGQVLLASGQVHERSVRLAAVPGTERRVAREEVERRRSEGRLVTAAEIESMSVRTLADIIRRVSPRMVGSTAMAGAATPVRARAQSSFLEDGMEPVVVIDGVRAPDPAQALDRVHPSEVYTMELLEGAAGGWMYGSDGAAGVIRVTTWKSHGGEARPSLDGCVVPNFPRR
jgi:hypothetical protein